jgi:DNA-nicking Smr family endonuclease
VPQLAVWPPWMPKNFSAANLNMHNPKKNEKFSDLYPDVFPIKNNNLFDSNLQKQKPKPIPHQTILGKKKILEESISNENYTKLNDKSESLWESTGSYHLKNGVAKRTLKHHKSSIFKPDQVLDLHGFKIEDAYFEFRDFINYCCKKKLRTLKIIHGKYSSKSSKNTIKNKIPSWLKSEKGVLAFCYAKNNAGGEGVTLVLLKNL